MGNTSAFSRAASQTLPVHPRASATRGRARSPPPSAPTEAGHSRFPVQTLFPQPRPALWFRVTGKADPSRSGLKRDLALTDPPPGCSCSSVDGSRPRGACPALPSQHDRSWTWPPDRGHHCPPPLASALGLAAVCQSAGKRHASQGMCTGHLRPTTVTMGVLSPPCLLGDQKSPRSQNMKSMVTRPAAVLSPVKQLHLPSVLPQPRPTEPETGRGAQRSAFQRVLQGVSRMLKDRCPQHASPEQGTERPRPAVLPAEQCVRRTRVFLGPGGAEPSSDLDRSHRNCHLRKINFYHI